MGQCREWSVEQFRIHAKSLGDAMIGYRDDEGLLLTIPQYEARIDVCCDCQFRQGNNCSAGLGCSLAIFARVRTQDCPKGKWNGPKRKEAR